jgi:hypothetical protein
VPLCRCGKNHGGTEARRNKFSLENINPTYRPRLYWFLFLLFSIPAILPAQIEVTWGVPQNQERHSRMTDMIGQDGMYVYTLRAEYSLFSERPPIVERYKLSDLSLDYSKSLSLKGGDGKDYDLESIYFIGGNILEFASHYDKDKNMNVLYAQVMDDHCMPKNGWMEVAKIVADKRSNAGSFYTGMSMDSTHILIVVNPPYEKYADEKFSLQLLDKNLKSEWEKDIIPPYKDEFFALDNFLVNDSGDVYMLATISKDKSVMSRSERRKTPTYYHSVLMYEHKSDELKEYEVKLDPKFISDVKMTVDSSGNMICAGFYSNKSSNAIIGTFYMKIDKKTKEFSNQGTMDFAKDFISQFMSERRAARGDGLANYILRYLVLRDDGGAVLVAEQYYEVMTQNYDPTNHVYTYTYYYYYNDIIVVSINPDGNIAWAQKIPKYQLSRNDDGYFSSFAFAVCGDKMYFMFNDNSKNAKDINQYSSRQIKMSDNSGPGKYKYMQNPKNAVAILVTVDSKGNQDRQVMFQNRDLKITFRPKLFMQMNEHRVILYGEGKSTFKLADVKIQ